MAFDVGPGIALDVALRLRGREHFVVAAVGLHHLGKNEVGAAVDDAADAPNAVRGQAPRQDIENGRSAANRGFVAQRSAVAAGYALQLQSVMREHVFVRRHDRLAGCQRLGDQRASRLVAAEQLHHDVHVVAPERRKGILDHQLARHAAIDGALDVQIRDGDQFQHAAAGRADLPVRAPQKAARHLRADGPHTEDRDAESRLRDMRSLLGGHRLTGLGPAATEMAPQPTVTDW